LYVGYSIIAKLFKPETAKSLAHSPLTIIEQPLRLIFTKVNKKNIRLLEKFNRGLGKLRRSAKIALYLQQSSRNEAFPLSNPKN